MSVVSNWIDAFQTTNLPEGVEPDPVSKWIVLTRASVFPMTFFAGAIGGMLAIPSGRADLLPWALATLGDWKRSDGKQQDRETSDGYGTGFVIYALFQHAY